MNLKKILLVITSFILAVSIFLQPKSASASSLSGLDQTLYQGMKEYRTEINVSKYRVTLKECEDHFLRVLGNHPEIFYVHVGKTLYYYDQNKKIVKVKVTYVGSKATIKKMKSKFDKTVAKIIHDQIKPSYSEFKKEKALHDYVVKTTSYDIKSWNNYIKTKKPMPSSVSTAYGALVNKKAVCDGYAKAMKLLLNKVGIKAYYVIGKGNGQLHAWNLVRINKKYYYLDATWDDPSPDQKGRLNFQYFNMTEKELKKDHTWSTKDLPKATSTTYKYMRNMKFPVQKGNNIYYSNSSDKDSLYRINEKGSSKKKLLNHRTYWLTEKSGRIYFSDYSNGGYIYKINTDGKGYKQVNNAWSTNLQIKGNYLYYKNEKDKKTYKVKI
ncbi:DUF5050 domain-containing protein [Heyndrickxia sp. NPDC080065]|uniref:DUF5050 domain-containing protein n=1 Tax=Heyndrickxia sp. NPDC080065 TaxID=3390568 RepID=UPI003D088E82